MRICYIVHSQCHFAAPYIDHFAREGHEIHLISFTHDPLPNAINHHPLPRDCDPTRSKLHYVRAIPTVRRLVRRIAPDLLHAHFLTSNGLVAAATGFHPLVVSARGSDVHSSMGRPARRALIRFVMRRADLVNPVSAELARKIAALGIPAAKTLCLTQGIEWRRLAVPRPPAPEGLVRMICTRRLEHPYQPLTIVAALAEVAAAGIAFRFTFAAGGRDEAAVRRAVEVARLSDRVTFLGGYAAAELPGLLAAADVYVSTSLWDGTSQSLLEAMAAGAYPVVTDCAANSEWLRGGEDGLLVPSDDAPALAGALVRAARQPAAWSAAAERNRRVVAERGDRETNLRLIGAEYARLVAVVGRGARGRRIGCDAGSSAASMDGAGGGPGAAT